MEKTTKKLVTGMKTLKLTNKEFLNKFFVSFQELSQLPSNPKTGYLKYAIKRSLGSVQNVLEKYTKARTEIFEERCKKDENGNPLFDKDKNYLFETSEIRIEAFSELEKLDEKVIDLTIYPIRKEHVLNGINTISIGVELNLEGFILPTEEEEKLINELEQ